MIKYILYFVAGGGLVVLATHFGSTNRGYWAAFVSTLPVIALVTLGTIFMQSGTDAAIVYAQGLILMTLPFLMFVSIFIWFLPYLGLLPSAVISLTAYIVASAILDWIRKI